MIVPRDIGKDCNIVQSNPQRRHRGQGEGREERGEGRTRDATQQRAVCHFRALLHMLRAHRSAVIMISTNAAVDIKADPTIVIGRLGTASRTICSTALAVRMWALRPTLSLPFRHENSNERLSKMPGYTRKREQKWVRTSGDVSRNTEDRGCVTRTRPPPSGKPHRARAKGKWGRGGRALSPLALPCSRKGDGRHIGNATYVVASHAVEGGILKVHR